MSDEVKEYWIYKGTSNFCNELVMNDEFAFVKQKTEGFYDIVSTKDTVEGGIHVISYSAYAALKEDNEKLRFELSAYRDQSPEDYLTPYENELLGDKDILRKKITALKETVKDFREALMFYTTLKTTESEHCKGSHSQYSSMYDSKICEKCGNDEDGPGGLVAVNKLSPNGDKARAVLLKHETKE